MNVEGTTEPRQDVRKMNYGNMSMDVSGDNVIQIYLDYVDFLRFSQDVQASRPNVKFGVTRELVIDGDDVTALVSIRNAHAQVVWQCELTSIGQSALLQSLGFVTIDLGTVSE